MKCPKCGTEVPQNQDRCPSCGVKIYDGREKKRQWRNRLLTVGFIIAVGIIIFILVIQPILSPNFRPLSQELIIQGDDLGPEWHLHGPTDAGKSYSLVGSIEAAYVSMGKHNDSSSILGDCSLSLFSSTDEASASYQRNYDGLANKSNISMAVLPYGDRAAIFSFNQEGLEGWDRILIIQKGKTVVWMDAHTMNGPNISIEEMTEIATIQADKIP